jgi:hypothetical protein
VNRLNVINKSSSYIKDTPYTNPNIFTKWFFKDNLSHAWCGAFVDYIFKHDLNCDWLDSCSNFGYVPTIVKWAKEKGYWNTDYKKSKKGDLVVFNFSSNKNYYSHIGIVDSVDNDNIISIDGNTNNSKYKDNMVLKKSRNKKYISGVILLPYKEEDMFNVGDYVYALEDIKLYTTIEYKESNYTLKKGSKAYVRYVKNKNVALADPITKEYFKSAWTNELNKLSKEPIEGYKELYEEELVKNKELQDKIDKAIEILRN